ncbi:MAG: hypothetical protein J0H14_00310 [Alphaproteobacteria bacterium]|nr:hypothetical protein [Alphaproteobacteria bacterium]
MTFTPTIPARFRYLDDLSIQEFVKDVCSEKATKSFERKLQETSFAADLQLIVQRHYLEYLVLLARKSSLAAKLFSRLTFGDLRNGYYEASEFLTISSSVYDQLAPRKREQFRARFNGLFNGPQGLIPLSHEMLTAHRLTQMGFKVEFIELSEEDRFDFRISKNGVVAELDCKSVVNDNGIFFDAATANVTYKILTKFIEKLSVMQNCILHLQIKSRNRAKYDFGLELKRAAEAAGATGSAETDVFHLQKVSFPDTFFDLEKTAEPQSSDNEICRAISKCIPGLDCSQVEAVYLTSRVKTRQSRTAVVLSSGTNSSWLDNIVRAIKESLNGQLSGARAPVLCIRFNNLSNEERSTLYWSESSRSDDGVRLSPSDAIAWEVARSTAEYRGRLCALMLWDQPTYSPSAILSAGGTPVYKQDLNVKHMYFPGNPVGFALRDLMENH